MMLKSYVETEDFIISVFFDMSENVIQNRLSNMYSYQIRVYIIKIITSP